MLNIIRRLLPDPPRRRALDAGGTGRRWQAGARIANLNTDILSTGRTIRERAAYQARNNAVAASAVNVLVTSIVGAGIVPSPQHPDPAERARLSDAFLRWTDRADFDGGGDFYALQALACRQMVETGESFVHLFLDENDDETPLRLRLLHPSQVPTEWPSALLDNGVRGGFEFDTAGRKVGVLALPFRPDDPFTAITASWTPIRLSIDEVVHLYEALEPGQIRGVSWLTPVLTALHEFDQLQDAALVRAKVSNLVCAALVDSDGDGGGLSGARNDGVLDIGLEPGTILPLKPGTSIEFFDPKESATYAPFTKSLLRSIAAGIGVPYELLTGDLEGVNYSSIRTGIVEFRKKLANWQHNVFVFRFCRPIWDRWIRSAVLTGLIDPRAYARIPEWWHAVEWLPPKPEWVDPAKDLAAETGAIEAGLMSRTQALAARGLDINKVRAEIAAEREADRVAGLTFTAPPPAAPEVPAP